MPFEIRVGKGLDVFKDIIMPSLKPAFLVSFINTFTFTMTTVGGIIFLVTPYTKVATAEMFDAIQEWGYRGQLCNGFCYYPCCHDCKCWIFMVLLEKKNNRPTKTEESYVPSIEAAQ